MGQKILNKRSTVVTDGNPKLPTAQQLEYGEIAINYAIGVETLSIKNSGNEIVTFSSDSIIQNEISNANRELSGNVLSYVDAAVVGVYRYKGSVTNYSDLSSIQNKVNGDVYNVINASGSIPAGTNFAWSETSNSWDSLGGSIDLSVYTTNDTFTAHTANTTAHVTSSEKSTWNGKQDAISDLSTIRNNASSGAAAYNGMITGVTINGSAATVSNKNASLDIEIGGGGSGLPSVTSADNGKILQVVNGQWAIVTPSTIYTGQGAPDNLLGIDGDIYLQTS